MSNSTAIAPQERFSDRVSDYSQFRPTYPSDCLKILMTNHGLQSSHTIADVGSGTGISSKLFLENNHIVYAVEPNLAMRQNAESSLGGYKNFNSVAGSSECTHLASQSIDFIVVAQAFHWFDVENTKKEFLRILKPEGQVVILFNNRKSSGSAFVTDYENLLKEISEEYKTAKHRNGIEQKHRSFYKSYNEYHFPYTQQLDFDSLLGRLRSSSYAPQQGHPHYDKMRHRLKSIFERHAVAGKVCMEYDTEMYCGKIE